MNPELLYFAGYFWADGSIDRNSCSLNIVQKDSKEVQAIVKNHLEFTTYFYENKSTDAIRQPQESIRFSLKKDIWLNNLIKTHFNNKSLDSPWFVLDFPEELQHYFWRGYSDGDGCFYQRHGGRVGGGWSISGPYDKDWSFELETFKRLNLSKKPVYRTVGSNGNKSSQIMFRNIKDVVKIGSFLYQGDNFGLQRKKNKYEKLVQDSEIKNLTSNFIGVNFDKASFREGRKAVWKCTYNRKHLGYFETQEDAKKIRDAYIESL